MTAETNKIVMHRFLEFINTASEILAQELISPDAIFHVPGRSEPMRGPGGEVARQPAHAYHGSGGKRCRRSDHHGHRWPCLEAHAAPLQPYSDGGKTLRRLNRSSRNRRTASQARQRILDQLTRLRVWGTHIEHRLIEMGTK